MLHLAEAQHQLAIVSIVPGLVARLHNRFEIVENQQAALLAAELDEQRDLSSDAVRRASPAA